MRKFVLFCFVLLLSGCATQSKYEAKLNSWVGHSEDEILSSWGIPANVYEINENKKMFLYRWAQNLVVPGTAPTYQGTFNGDMGFANYSGGTPAQNIFVYCDTTFVLDNKVVTSWSIRGNKCTSY